MPRRKLVRVIRGARVRNPSIKVVIRLPVTTLLDLELTESSQADDTKTDYTLKQEPRPQLQTSDAASSAVDDSGSGNRTTSGSVGTTDSGSGGTITNSTTNSVNSADNNAANESAVLPGYRKVPPNIFPILENELKMLNPDMEELGIDRIIFSLLDPLSKTRIDLPVKSNRCVHFECFDYGSFCMFNKIPQGVQFLLRRAMTKLALELLRFQKAAGYMYSPVKIIDMLNNNSTKKSTGKEYRCPICDTKFPLLDLIVSISFNYFIKGTPKDVEKIELVEMFQYRTISEREFIEKRSQSEEVILLSDEDEDDEDTNIPIKAHSEPIKKDAPSTEKDITDDMADEIEAIIQGAYDDDDFEEERIHQMPRIAVSDSDGDDQPIVQSEPVSLDVALQVLSPYLARYRDEYVHRYGQSSSNGEDQYEGSGSHDDPVTID